MLISDESSAVKCTTTIIENTEMSFILLDGSYVMTSHYANLICLSISVLLELEFDKKTHLRNSTKSFRENLHR